MHLHSSPCLIDKIKFNLPDNIFFQPHLPHHISLTLSHTDKKKATSLIQPHLVRYRRRPSDCDLPHPLPVMARTLQSFI